jgi:glycosyltransferase involved in cell wall biosynthesis
MRIVLDATPLASAGAGSARYVTEVSVALARCFPADDVCLASDQRFQRPECAPVNLTLGRGPQNVLERRWWLWGAMRESVRLRAEIFHGTNFEVPLIPAVPSVVTLLDLSPWIRADWVDEDWRTISTRVRQRGAAAVVLGLAGMVITLTEAVRREAIERFRLHASKVVAVPLAASARFRPRPLPHASQPYFLFVGTIEPRKNVPMLIEAWRVVRKRHHIDLLLAGRLRPGVRLFDEPGLKILGEVPDDTLPELYSNAVACLYPSFYEGFGLPPLEAMQSGCPAIVSRQPSIAEVAGDAALGLDANDPKSWAEAMTAFLTSDELRSSWRERGLRRAAEFSWDQTARKTREVYVEARRRF